MNIVVILQRMIVSLFAMLVANTAMAWDKLPNLPSKSQYAFQDKDLEPMIASFVYKGVQSPNRARNQAAGALVYYGFELFDYGDELLNAAYLVKQHTRFSFGDCGKLAFKFNRMIARSCLNDSMYVELNSEYDLDSVALKFSWALETVEH